MSVRGLHIPIWIWWLAAGLLFGSCEQLTIRVESLPANTPPGTPIFIAGNFNFWDPGDQSFQLIRQPDSSWAVTLPKGFGTVEFKFTRGDWTTVEADECGNNISNRSYRYVSKDTIVASVASWHDLNPLNCSKVTLVLTDLPENTPNADEIMITGSFNNWGEADTNYQFENDVDGRQILTLPKPSNATDYEYKIIRGSLAASEGDEFGHELPHRKLTFGQRDTVFVSVQTWEDLEKQQSSSVTLILDELPQSTPADDDIYLVGNFNNWYPRDQRLSFKQLPDGRWGINLPAKSKDLEFKITRGDWGTVEVDQFGNEMDNRKHRPTSGQDTLYIKVENWRDLKRIEGQTVTFVIEELPANTPENARIYLSGSMNGWRGSASRYEFKKGKDGQYRLNLPTYYKPHEFKLTRGNWESAEVDAFGSERANRKMRYRGNKEVALRVDGWKDMPSTWSKASPLVIVVNRLPQNTPKKATLYFASSLNNWDPNANDYAMQKDAQGRYFIVLRKTGTRTEFKFTRGGWRTVETTKNGNDIANRYFQRPKSDTLFFQISGWRDQ